MEKITTKILKLRLKLAKNHLNRCKKIIDMANEGIKNEKSLIRLIQRKLRIK